MDFHKFMFPQMAPVKQGLYRSSVTEITSAVTASLEKSALFSSLPPGTRIAVAVGSRGITRIDAIVSSLVAFLKARQLKPFIVPAMGSHGGATPAGQLRVLAGLGITQDHLEIPFETDMSSDCIDRLACGMPIFFSRAARAADYIFVVNRVKPHTKFTAARASGLAKMLAVGLGMAAGAAEIHRFAVNHSFDIIFKAAAKIIAACPVLGGLAIIEDGYGRPAVLETVAAADIMTREKELLRLAVRMMPKIPLDKIDLLIVDWIGKNISGIGMDSNITGRHRDITGDFFSAPHVKRIFVRNLTPESQGNANGIGLADFTTTRLVKAMNREKTYANALAAISPEKAAIPIRFDSDRQAIAAALDCCGLENTESARIVRIKDTAHLGRFLVSGALAAEIGSHQGLSLDGAWSEMVFDPSGNLAEAF